MPGADFDAEELILNVLEENGFDRAELPGPGDLQEAIQQAGFELKKQSDAD